ncbi:hypothetical protein ACFUTV_22045 [Streptomyces sp. NPDC057298]|uniref:hypothetical protein n=1 Tax=Streptomyces sp. NPDC057298 TaxID=3346091 RepID=UPI0036387382
MRRWWKWIGAAVTTGAVVSGVMTLVGDKSWGWDFVARWILFSTVYALLGPVVERSWRRSEERDAQRMRDIQEARRGRHSQQGQQKTSGQE